MKTLHYIIIGILISCSVYGLYEKYEYYNESTNMTIYPETTNHENLVKNPDFDAVNAINGDGYELATNWFNAEKGIHGKPMYTVSKTGINSTNAIRMIYCGNTTDTNKVRSVMEMYQAPILGAKAGDTLRLSVYVSGHVENSPVIVGVESFNKSDGNAAGWIKSSDVYVHDITQRPQLVNVIYHVPKGTASVGVYVQAQEISPNSKIDISIDHVVLEHVTPEEASKYTSYAELYYKLIFYLRLLFLFFIPSFITISEISVSIRNSLIKYKFTNTEENEYTILVPIYGNVKYLENIDYLKQYGNKVMLCTSGNEKPEFYRDFKAIATIHGFKIFIDKPNSQYNTDGKLRALNSTKRDTIVMNALKEVGTYFTVCLDADSTTDMHISYLIGELEKRNLDFASIRVKPIVKGNSIIAKLQSFEYETAMNLRFMFPYLVSGCCHCGKTNVLENVMNRHSKFFQGNDIETGIICKGLGYKVGHIPFVVNTEVPNIFRDWFRQRIAWNSGEFRLFIINARYVFKFPVFWIYGLLAIVGYPLRIISLFNFFNVLYVLVLYIALLIGLHAKRKNPMVLLMPLYALFQSLMLTPLGIIYYIKTIRSDGNYGIIRI
jgi:hypothetical protein